MAEDYFTEEDLTGGTEYDLLSDIVSDPNLEGDDRGKRLRISQWLWQDDSYVPEEYRKGVAGMLNFDNFMDYIEDSGIYDILDPLIESKEKDLLTTDVSGKVKDKAEGYSSLMFDAREDLATKRARTGIISGKDTAIYDKYVKDETKKFSKDIKGVASGFSGNIASLIKDKNIATDSMLTGLISDKITAALGKTLFKQSEYKDKLGDDWEGVNAVYQANKYLHQQGKLDPGQGIIGDDAQISDRHFLLENQKDWNPYHDAGSPNAANKGGNPFYFGGRTSEAAYGSLMERYRGSIDVINKWTNKEGLADINMGDYFNVKYQKDYQNYGSWGDLEQSQLLQGGGMVLPQSSSASPYRSMSQEIDSVLNDLIKKG